MRGLLKTAVLAAGSILLATPAGARADFTVAKSIALNRFSDPFTRDSSSSSVKYSPDGKRFAVVTTRGLLKNNQMESTIWLFDMRQAGRYLRSPSKAVPPRPRRLTALRGRIAFSQEDSYGSLISSLKWAPDSRSIYFLGEADNGTRRLYNLPLKAGARATVLTPQDQTVDAFDTRSGTVAYTFRPMARGKSALPGAPINPTATDITGLDIPRVLFPTSVRTDSGNAQLGLVRNGRATVLRDPQTGEALALNFSSTRAAPAVSPDGRFVVLLLPVKMFPDSWTLFQADLFSLKFKPRAATATARSEFLWPAQYALVDIDRGAVSPLYDAPNAWVAGYADASIIMWSSDAKTILLGNSFLPIPAGGQPLQPNSIAPCALVAVKLLDHLPHCLAMTRSHSGVPGGLSLSSAAFVSPDGKTIRAMFRRYNSVRTEIYEAKGEGWNLANGISTAPGNERDVSATVEQDLNEPPALWVRDANGHARKLWDPTPELAGMKLGETSVFKWHDTSGFEDTGLLVKPPGYVEGVRYPLIIQTHGAHNEHEFVTDGAFTTAFAARAFAAAGFVVLEVRDRHDNHSSAKEAPQMVAAFESAIDVLNEKGMINPDRVGIIGFSRTCWYVESALLHAPLRYAAASITDGIDQSYMQYMLFDVDRIQAEGPHIYGASPFGQGLKGWTDNAPSFHLDRVQAPLMITAISPSSVLEEWEIYAALRQQFKPVDFLYIPNGQHILQNPLERLASEQSNVDWFRFWLQGYEDPVQVKADQYRRWESLCDLQVRSKSSRSTFCVPTKQ